MPVPLNVPHDFRAVVLTLPAAMDVQAIAALQRAVQEERLPELPGHRILHMHQVERADSSAVAALVEMLERVTATGYEVLVCEPPPVAQAYLELYGAHRLLRDRVLFSDADGRYQSPLVAFVPPFVASPGGRVDVYERGKARSFLLHAEGLRETAPVDLKRHAPKMAARTAAMLVREERTAVPHELKATALVLLRRHQCGCGATHELFARLHRLHQWYRGKGADLRALELWASDMPTGMVVERLVFRDRAHLDEFRTMLKVDTSWREVAPTGTSPDEELHYLYA